MANSQRYNILFLEIGFARGGSSNFLYHRIKLMNRKVFNPIIAFYYENHGPDLKKLKLLGIPILFLVSLHQWYKELDWKQVNDVKRFRLTRKFDTLLKVGYEVFLKLKLVIKIIHIIQRYKIHLVALNNDIHYHLPAILAAKVCSRPIICRKAGIGNGGRIARQFIRFIDVIFAISQATEHDALAFGAKRERVIWMYEGITVADYQPEVWQDKKQQIRDKLEIPPEATVIGTVSRLASSKGQEALLSAAALLVNEYHNLVFLIVGDDDHQSHRYRKSLEQQAQTLKLGRHIKFLGWYENIPEVLSIMDIFVQNPNYPEGLGIANLEAMAMAKPTIVTKMGGLAEATVNNETGLIVSDCQPEHLADAINMLLRDSRKARSMGWQARKRVEERFDLAKNIEKIDAIFYHAIHG